MALSAGATGFEGPEKILEIDFMPIDECCVKGGVRRLERSDWDKILSLAQCRILHESNCEEFDAYILSESTLVVYSHKIFLKTCGTTTLLRCVPELLEIATKTLGLELEWLGYSRKNFTFPDDQAFPHTSFTQEVEYAEKRILPQGEQLRGGAYVLGDLMSDHWFVYVADYCERASQFSRDRNINLMMYDLDPQAAKMFYRNPSIDCPLEDGLRAAKRVGLHEFMWDNYSAKCDAYMFEPCGFSLNALDGKYFHTIHVTPELEFSYASYETNMKTRNYLALIRQILSVFRPKRFTMTLFADAASFLDIEGSPTLYEEISLDAKGITVYKRINRASTSFKTDYVCQMSNYVLDDDPVPPTDSRIKKNTNNMQLADESGVPADIVMDTLKHEVERTHE